jgi:hypothetical protein
MVSTKELVIAAYERDLSWLNNVNQDVKITVYRKGNALPLKDNEIKIEPNLGRCVHTFFNHLYLNYDNLSDYTFFAQDYPFDHWGNILEMLNGDIEVSKNSANLKIGGYYGFNNNSGNNGIVSELTESLHFSGRKVLRCSPNGQPHHPGLNVSKYWNYLFSDSNKTPEFYEFIPGGHFFISKDHAKLRSKNFYKKIVDILIKDPGSPWIIERMEGYIFDIRLKDNHEFKT